MCNGAGCSKDGFWITPGLSDADLGNVDFAAGTGLNPSPGWAANFPAESVTDTLGMTVGFAVEDIGDQPAVGPIVRPAAGR